MAKNLCAHCGMEGCSFEHFPGEFPFQSSQFLFRMSPELSTLVHGFKYRQLRRHIPFLCAYLRFRPGLIMELQSCDALIPVPIHHIRRRERTYNQSEIIAQELASLTGKPVMSKVLKRTRYTESQTKLAKQARSHNLESAFALSNAAGIKGKKLILVDDVFTTGATATQCSALLLEAGCLSVDVFALAKVEAADAEKDFTRELEAASGYFS